MIFQQKGHVGDCGGGASSNWRAVGMTFPNNELHDGQHRSRQIRSCVRIRTALALPEIDSDSGRCWRASSNASRLVELHPDWAIVELAENGSRRIFDRRRLEVGNVRLPWIGA